MGIYDKFEDRYKFDFFSASWGEIDMADCKPAVATEIKVVSARKDVKVLESELEEIQAEIESIREKQLRLANLAKMYE